jgi:hypothetical protein
VSEYVSYSVSATPGGAVEETLRRRGVFFHDDAAWQNAEERAEVLRKELKQALDSMCGRNSSLSELVDRSHLEISRLQGMMASFCKVREFKTYADQAHGGEFKELRGKVAALIDAAQKSIPGRDFLNGVIRAQKGTENFAAMVQKELCFAEKEAVLNTVASTLSGMGYLVEARGDSLKATCDQMGVWAKAGEHGELAMDLSGFSGLSCMKEMARIEEQLTRRGVRLQRTASNPHGRPEGGVLAEKLRSLFPQFRRIETTNIGLKGFHNFNQGKESSRS